MYVTVIEIITQIEKDIYTYKNTTSLPDLTALDNTTFDIEIYRLLN